MLLEDVDVRTRFTLLQEAFPFRRISAMVLHVQHQALTAIDTLNIRIDMRQSARIRCVHHDIIARILDPRAQSVSTRTGRNKHVQAAVCSRVLST